MDIIASDGTTRSVFVSVETTARFLGVSRGTAYSLAHSYLDSGEGIRCVRLGARLARARGVAAGGSSKFAFTDLVAASSSRFESRVVPPWRFDIAGRRHSSSIGHVQPPHAFRPMTIDIALAIATSPLDDKIQWAPPGPWTLTAPANGSPAASANPAASVQPTLAHGPNAPKHPSRCSAATSAWYGLIGVPSGRRSSKCRCGSRRCRCRRGTR